jgi:hypothetical protein
MKEVGKAATKSRPLYTKKLQIIPVQVMNN